MQIGIGQIGAGQTRAEARVVGAFGLEAGGQVAEAFAMGQLSEAQRQEVIVGGEAAWGSRRGKESGAAGELGGIKVTGDLGEDRTTGRHVREGAAFENRIEDKVPRWQLHAEPSLPQCHTSLNWTAVV